MRISRPSAGPRFANLRPSTRFASFRPCTRLAIVLMFGVCSGSTGIPTAWALPPQPIMRPAPVEELFFRRNDAHGRPICWLRLTEEQRGQVRLFHRRRKRRHGFTSIDLTTEQIRQMYAELRLWKIPTRLWLNSSKVRNWFLAVPEASLRNGLVFQGGTPREWSMP